MHQCALCNPKYGNCFRTLWLFWVLCYTCGYQILCVVGDEMSVNLLCDGTIIFWVVRTYLVIGIGKFVGFFLYTISLFCCTCCCQIFLSCDTARWCRGTCCCQIFLSYDSARWCRGTGCCCDGSTWNYGNCKKAILKKML